MSSFSFGTPTGAIPHPPIPKAASSRSRKPLWGGEGISGGPSRLAGRHSTSSSSTRRRSFVICFSVSFSVPMVATLTVGSPVTVNPPMGADGCGISPFGSRRTSARELEAGCLVCRFRAGRFDGFWRRLTCFLAILCSTIRQASPSRSGLPPPRSTRAVVERLPPLCYLPLELVRRLQILNARGVATRKKFYSVRVADAQRLRWAPHECGESEFRGMKRRVAVLRHRRRARPGPVLPAEDRREPGAGLARSRLCHD